MLALLHFRMCESVFFYILFLYNNKYFFSLLLQSKDNNTLLLLRSKNKGNRLQSPGMEILMTMRVRYQIQLYTLRSKTQCLYSKITPVSYEDWINSEDKEKRIWQDLIYFFSQSAVNPNTVHYTCFDWPLYWTFLRFRQSNWSMKQNNKTLSADWEQRNIKNADGHICMFKCSYSNYFT